MAKPEISGGQIKDGTIYDVDVAANASISISKLDSTVASKSYVDAAVANGGSPTGSTSIVTLGTVATGTWNATAVGVAYGGTGLASCVLGDILYGSGTNTLSRLAGNTTATRKFLRQTGTGTVSATPAWDTLTASDVPTIAQSQVTNLSTDLSAKAPLASPTFTGTPAAPTASAFTNSTQVATTAYTDAAIVQLTGYIPGGRLTNSSVTPEGLDLPANASTSIFYVPYVHNKIVLWNGTRLQSYTIPAGASAVSASVSNTSYAADVFAYADGSGNLALETVSWTSLYARSTAIVMGSNSGFYVKNGDETRRYLGSFYTEYQTSSGKGVTAYQIGMNQYYYGSSTAAAYCTFWNYYNRISRPMWSAYAGSPTTSTTTGYNPLYSGYTSLFVGVVDKPFSLQAWTTYFYNSASGTTYFGACSYGPTTSYGAVTQTLSIAWGGVSTPGATTLLYPSLGYNRQYVVGYCSGGTSTFGGAGTFISVEC